MNVKGISTATHNKLLDSPCIQSDDNNFDLKGKSRRVRDTEIYESLVSNLIPRGTKDLNMLHVVTNKKIKKSQA